MKKTGSLCLLLCGMLIYMSGCNTGSEKAPNVSDVKIELQTSRFDKDLSAIDTNHMAAGLQQLEAKYPDFLNYFLDTFMTFGVNRNFSDTNRIIINDVKPLIAFRDFANLQKEINNQYPNTKDVDAALTEGFQYMKHYFPSYHVPRIIYMNTFLSQYPTFGLDSNTLCIGLDWFLGDDYPHYADRGVPPYVKAHQRRSYIPVSVFSVVYHTSNFPAPTDKTLLDFILQKGRQQYFLHKILPHASDSVLFGYEQHKLDWCTANEAVIYNFFVHQNLLFTKEMQNIMPYINDGPFAVNFPDNDPQKNTPGNIGTWLGYRIVYAYMAQNPSITLDQLMRQQIPASQFLDAAKYRPK